MRNAALKFAGLHVSHLRITLMQLALGVAALSAVFAAKAQRIVASPGSVVLSGDPLKLVVVELPAGALVTLHSSRVLFNDGDEPRRYQAQARFKADAKGRIDLSLQQPLNGSYSGADVRGLFWSMTPSDALSNAAGGSSNAAEKGTSNEAEVTLTARIDGAVVASKIITLLAADPRLNTTEVDGFPGALLVSLPGTTRRPAIIVLGGSEGGTYVARLMAPKFASHGFVVLGLPYYSPSGYGANGATPPELPQLPAAFADIPVDRLQQARDWLAQQPNIDAARIAVYGVSKGAEFALIASTRMTWIKAVVALVPSDVVWEGWGPGADNGDRSSFSWNGEPLSYVPYLDFAGEFDGFRTNTPVIVRRPQDRGRAANPDRVPAARIPVERYAGPMLLVAGTDDQLWDSGGMATSIAAARKKHRAALPLITQTPITQTLITQTLIYPDAGHLISGDGWRPTTQYNVSLSKVGGTPQGNAHAQADAWPKTLAFLKRHLGPVPR